MIDTIVVIWYYNTTLQHLQKSVNEMSEFLKLSEASSLALHTMAILTVFPEKLSTRKIAEILKASPHHLSKIMQRLVKIGMVESVRGPHGGFKLVKEAREINLLEIYEVIEGPFKTTECTICSESCMISNMLRKMEQDFIDLMSQTNIETFAHAVKTNLSNC